MRLKCFLLSLLLFFLSAPTLVSEPLVHILQKGETIFGVAKLYSVPYEAILAANSIEDPRRVLPGTKLVIPATHIVVKGETLYGIARSYGIPLADLMKANHLDAGAVIKPGDVLVVPGGTSAVQSPPPGPTAPDSSAPGGTAPQPPILISTGVWPVQGEARYLEGKLFGIGIQTEENALIHAVRSGTVVSAGPFRGFGRVAFVQAKDGLVYVYGGAETLGVRVGQTIRAGAEIGRVGIDLKEGKPIAYFLVFKNGKPLDPVTVPRERAEKN